MPKNRINWTKLLQMNGFVLFLLLVFVFVVLLWGSRRRKKVHQLPKDLKAVLEKHVAFYRQLDAEGKHRFEARMQKFLAQITITGVRTEVEPIDRVLIAASAIIPIFGFANWEYTNLREVLVYPDSFDHEFNIEGAERNVLGMVGWGVMQNQMILSKLDLRNGFMNKDGAQNTAIHEFVHLIDKTDGATDGIPENIMQQQYIIPWLDLMHRKIKDILNGRSDINPYGATNEAEFFAVVSEYFFERPDLLQERHPDLYHLLDEIFQPVKIAPIEKEIKGT